MAKTALIIGAGPAGLTMAYELQKRTDYQPVILEMSHEIGGISRTVEYNGNRMDIGGHRFFSKSERVMNFWLDLMPPGDAESSDNVMMERSRLSRILFLRKFFDYPITLNAATLKNLGLARIWKIGWSYIAARLFRRNEQSLEDFYINRFGRELYETFFEDYTEKVWGVPCAQIPAEWGAQRVKGLSVAKTLLHAVRSLFGKRSAQVETSLIDRFYYPKFGPGQLWETLRDRVVEMGATLVMGQRVVGLAQENGRVTAVTARDENGELHQYTADIICSTMPVRELIAAMNDVPEDVRHVADALPYRDFMTMGLLLSQLQLQDSARPGAIEDNWIYIQERDVEIGRLQLFHNWSPYMVREKGTCFLGLEYFCNEGDRLWQKTDDEFRELALSELCKLGIVRREDVLDSVIVRQQKAYPAYFGSYGQFSKVRAFLDSIENLYPLGRNGMHRYNNMDHSMLTAMITVDQLIAGRIDREVLWSVNAEQEYHEQK